MHRLDIIVIGIALAMDAFAISICKGLSIKKDQLTSSIIVGLYFGIFQGLMPIIGYLFGKTFENAITRIDHWIAFSLLSIIGINMIKESFIKEEFKINNELNIKNMLPLAIATSIDALTVGITFAFLKVNIPIATLTIFVITFILSTIGVIIGNKFGTKLNKKSELLGGIILILMGIKILIEHLNVV